MLTQQARIDIAWSARLRWVDDPDRARAWPIADSLRLHNGGRGQKRGTRDKIPAFHPCFLFCYKKPCTKG
jgi:hypothetical protein